MITVAAIRDRYQQRDEPLRSERRLELLLLALVALVVLQLLVLGLGKLGSSSVDPVAPSADSMNVAAADGVGAISAEQSRAMRSRPLFWESRRPVTEEDAPEEVVTASDKAAAPARRIQKLNLKGVIGAGDAGTAIVVYKGERMRLRVGDELEGWTLQSVSGQEAVFVSAGARDVRRLMPLPVVAVADPAEEETLEDAAASSQEPSPVQDSVTTDDAERPKGTLSLGGFNGAG